MVQFLRRLEYPPGIHRSRRVASAIKLRTSSSVMSLMSTFRRFAISGERVSLLRGVRQGSRLAEGQCEPSEHLDTYDDEDLLPLSETLGIPPLKIGHPEIPGKLF